MGHVFVVTEVGSEGTTERQRADEISQYVIEPVLAKFNLELKRADKNPAPGRITRQLIEDLVSADVVIVDLTNRNANVYYELAIAHSFGLKVVTLIDQTHDLVFDVKDERAIPLGKFTGELGVRQAQSAVQRLEAAMAAVFEPDYRPNSAVSEAALTRQLDDISVEDPVAKELESLRDSVDAMASALSLISHHQGTREFAIPVDLMPEDLQELITRRVHRTGLPATSSELKHVFASALHERDQRRQLVARDEHLSADPEAAVARERRVISEAQARRASLEGLIADLEQREHR